MDTIKQTLFTGWHLMRWVRLAFGIFFVVQAIQMHDALMGAAGGFFLFTAITNTGCCGAGRCAAPIQKENREEPKEITFEEIKS
jgi:hypothetical protein